ncbi:MAG TPA: hypothetical protein VNG91_05225, partial [Terriglobia bacterium]|nr:hypothetical protein [Terriglobia bacterium]
MVVGLPLSRRVWHMCHAIVVAKLEVEITASFQEMLLVANLSTPLGNRSSMSSQSFLPGILRLLIGNLLAADSQPLSLGYLPC